MPAKTKIALLLRGRKNLLKDEFSQAAISALWTETDTENKLSLSAGGLLCAGGKDSPGWDDPKIISTGTFTRANGKTVEFELTPNSTGATQRAEIGFSGAAGLFQIEDDGALVHVECLDAGSAYKTIVADLVRGTSYRFKQVLLSGTGSLFYISYDNGVTWKLLWIGAGAANNFNVLYNSYSLPFTSKYIVVYQGIAKAALVSLTPSAPSPSLGSELVLNPGFETAGGGGADVFASWDETAGTGALADEGSLVHAGSHAVKLTAGASVNTQIGQNVVVSAGRWYQLEMWTRTGDGTVAGMYQIWNVSGGSALISRVTTGISGTTYAKKTVIFKTPTGCVEIVPALFCPNSNTKIAYFDDISFKLLSVASTLSSAGDPGIQEGVFDCAPTLPDNPSIISQCGIAVNLDSVTAPTYGIFAYHNGTNVIVEKMDNGAYTQLISAAATYSAGATLRLVIIGTSVSVWYNGTQVGTTQTIANITAYGTKVAGFSTNANNTTGQIAVNKG